MVDDFGVPVLGQHGGRRPGAGRPRKGEVRPPKQRIRGNLKNTGSDYVIARLTRDAKDGVRTAAALLQGIRDGLISPHAAACEMFYRQRPLVNGRGSENAAKRRDWALHRLLNPRRPDVKEAAAK
jgi:hypothetical protein